MIFQFANFAETTLSVPLSAGGSTLFVPQDDSLRFPDPSGVADRVFALILFDGQQEPEIVWATTNSGNGQFTVMRGQEGTGATSWRAGTAVIHALTRESIEYFTSGGQGEWIEELQQELQTLYDLLEAERIARLALGESLAAYRIIVSSQFGESAASVQQISQAFADLERAFASYQVTITAQTGDATANATQALNVATTSSQATAQLETFVIAAVGNNAATFSNKIQAFSDFNVAQLSFNTTIATRVGDAEALVQQEIDVRSAQYEAQTSFNTTQSSRIGLAEGAITTESQTRASQTEALAQTTQTLRADLNGVGAQSSQSAGAIANAGGLDAWWEVGLIAGSALAGIRARANSTGGSQIGIVADAIALFNTVLGVAIPTLVAEGGNVRIAQKLTLGLLGQIELDPQYPAIIWTIGSAKLFVGGHPNQGLIFWFGPNLAVNDMLKSNGTVWLDNVGNAFFGGSIIAGLISNSAQGTSMADGATLTVGPFGTNGNPITVNWSYNYNRTSRGPGERTVSGSNAAQIRLFQTIGGGAETLVGTMNLTGTASIVYDGDLNRSTLSGNIAGSQTFTDSVGGTLPRSYRVEVTSRTEAALSPGTVTSDSRQQRYGITTSEN